ncbi:ferric iron uptake transcriptional regulator [Massilia sp. CCM 8733]|uniref:Ferric uptake regulation protein n=1 Tax=Massilia mucilaginosa TaxID=2609282 RepID=A0ABX0NSZ9_9BURK|nr:ferric iron uptake transcriptional regulator [Massilia mucilaginosa]NHZ89926.1 ferric iron uptake transcriptional regulator [Massilia mucilaginosa]
MDIPKELRDSGLKATLPRVRILQLFQDGQHKHMSADEVYLLLHREPSDIGLATVYRVLMQLVDARILVRNQFESPVAVFELNQGGLHDHLVCTSCGQLEEFCDDALEHRQEEVARKLGFALREHSLSLYGTCVRCASEAGPSPKIRRS